MTAAQREMHDIAYGCFLAPGASALIVGVGVADAIPMDVGFLVLIPLAMVALASAAIGVLFSTVLWRDGILPLLSILTILMVAEIVTEAGSVAFYNATGPVYGVVVLVFEASWFLLRRRRAYPT